MEFYIWIYNSLIFNLLYAVEDKSSDKSSGKLHHRPLYQFFISIFPSHRSALQPWSNINKGAVIPRFECSITVGPKSSCTRKSVRKSGGNIHLARIYSFILRSTRVESVNINNWSNFVISYLFWKMKKNRININVKNIRIEIIMIEIIMPDLNSFLEFYWMWTSVNVSKSCRKSKKIFANFFN